MHLSLSEMGVVCETTYTTRIRCCHTLCYVQRPHAIHIISDEARCVLQRPLWIVSPTNFPQKWCSLTSQTLSIPQHQSVLVSACRLHTENGRDCRMERVWIARLKVVAHD